MGMAKEVSLASGAVARYWKIAGLHAQFGAKTAGTVDLHGYIDKNARDDDKKELEYRQVQIDFGDEEPSRAVAYTILSSMEGDFKGAQEA